MVHTLVALAFKGKKPTNQHSVDHIDRNKKNNCAKNLSWTTASEQEENSSHTTPIQVFKE